MSTSQWKDQKVHHLEIYLTDMNMKSEKYELKVAVTNTAPFFKTFLEDIEMHLN